jgi:transcriptional regulator with PAS, ATPase and Fis domain
VDSKVLLEGQSVVGKGVICKLIHKNSSRKDGPFIKIDCGSIPENLIESELFGYEQGAFTGAEKGGKIGLIEAADKGTLFLDEIGELPLGMQKKLLRTIQDKEVFRIGSNKANPVDIRIIAATNRNLKTMVKKKRFRKDLFYRLNVVPIYIPPLSKREKDIQPLIERSLKKFNEKYGLNKKISPEALKYLIDFNWPGNVRELENVVEYLIVTSQKDIIGKDMLPDNILEYKDTSKINVSLDKIPSLKDAVDMVEKNLLIEAMKKSNNTKEMAKLLGVDRSTVSRKLKKYEIESKF